MMSFREVTYRDRERLNQDAKELVSEFTGSATLDFCCCDNPPCVIDVDEVDRVDNANVNTGSLVTWGGDTGSFTVSSGALITSASNKKLTAQACDRIRCRVYRTGSTSGSAEARVGMTHGTDRYGYVRWPATGGTPVLGIVGGTMSAEIDAPLLVSTTSTVLSMCVKEMQGPDPDPTNAIKPFLGLYLYSETGDYKVFTHIYNDTWDPDTAAFGTGFIGTGTVNSGNVCFTGYQSEHQSGEHGTAWDECKVCNPCPCLVCQDDILVRGVGEPITTLQCGWQIQAGSWGASPYDGDWGLSFNAYALLAAGPALTTDLLCQGMAAYDGMLTTTMHALSDNRTSFRLAATSTNNSATPSGLVAEHDGGYGYGTLVSGHKLYVGGSLVASCQSQVSSTDDVSGYIYMGLGYVASEFYDGSIFILVLNNNTGTPFSPGFGLGANPASDGAEYTSASVSRTASDFRPYCTSPNISCVIFVAQNIYFDNRDLTNQSKVLRVLSGTVVATGLGSAPTLGGIEFDDVGAAEYLIPHPTLSGGGSVTAFVSISDIGSGSDPQLYLNTSPVDEVDVSITFGDDCRVQVEFGVAADFTEQPRYPFIDPGISPTAWQWYRLHLWISGAEVAVSPWLIYDASYPSGGGHNGSMGVWFNICIGDGAIVVYPLLTTDAPIQYAVIHYDISGPPYPGSGYWGFKVDNLPAGWRALGVVDTLAYDTTSVTDPRFEGLDVPTCYACVNPAPCSGMCTPDPPMPYMIKATVSGIVQGTGSGDSGSAPTGYPCESGECEDLNLVLYLFRECFVYPLNGVSTGCSASCSYIALMPPYTMRPNDPYPPVVTCDGWITFARVTLALDGGSGLPYWQFSFNGTFDGFFSAGTATGTPDAANCSGPTSMTLPVDAAVLAVFNDGDGDSIYCDFSGMSVDLELFYW